MLQRRTLASYMPYTASGDHHYKPATVIQMMGMTGWTTLCPWSKEESLAVQGLLIRSGMVIHLEKQLKDACDPSEHLLETLTAKIHGVPPPSARSEPQNAQLQFDISRFIRAALGESLVELVHVKKRAWLVIVILSGGNMVHYAGYDLAVTLLCGIGMITIAAVLLLWQMTIQLHKLCNGIVGHPRSAEHEFYKAEGVRPKSYHPDDTYKKFGLKWSGSPKTHHPWTRLSGCCKTAKVGAKPTFCKNLDPLLDENLLVLFQSITLASCFTVGQMCMLSQLVLEHMGVHILAACWLLPIITLVEVVPRALLVFTLCHRTGQPPRHLLVHSLKEKNDPKPHAHGHGHGHKAQHEHLSAEDVERLQQVVGHDFGGKGAQGQLLGKSATRKDAIEELQHSLKKHKDDVTEARQENSYLRGELLALGWTEPAQGREGRAHTPTARARRVSTGPRQAMAGRQPGVSPLPPAPLPGDYSPPTGPSPAVTPGASRPRRGSQVSAGSVGSAAEGDDGDESALPLVPGRSRDQLHGSGSQARRASGQPGLAGAGRGQTPARLAAPRRGTSMSGGRQGAPESPGASAKLPMPTRVAAPGSSGHSPKPGAKAAAAGAGRSIPIPPSLPQPPSPRSGFAAGDKPLGHSLGKPQGTKPDTIT